MVLPTLRFVPRQRLHLVIGHYEPLVGSHACQSKRNHRRVASLSAPADSGTRYGDAAITRIRIQALFSAHGN